LCKNPIIKIRNREFDLLSCSLGIELNPSPVGLYYFLLLNLVIFSKNKSEKIIEDALNYDIFGFLRDNVLNNCRFHDDVYNVDRYLKLLNIFVRNFILFCSDEVCFLKLLLLLLLLLLI
jgi:hypothetical protein